MKTIKYTSIEYKKVVDDLLKQKVVGFPTETVYGLAIIYNSKDAFDKLYEIKQRSINKPISMMVSDISIMHQVAYISKKQQKVIDTFMPGSLTVILKAKENLPEFVTFNYPTIGIRIPTNEVALNILKEVGQPLLVSSANISNEPSLVLSKDVYEKFDGKIASMIDEDASIGVASTVVDLTNDEIKILREGPIKKEDIEKVLMDENS